MIKNRLKKVLIGIVFVLVIVTQLPAQHTVKAVPQLPNNSCVDCHRKFLFSTGEAQFIDMRLKHLENGISCSIDCHEDKQNQSTASSYALWSISAHAQFKVTCEKCHGGDPLVVTKIDAHTGLSNDSIARENTPETCGKCHESQLDEFKSSLHFKRLESGEDVPAPACITCHQAHSVHVLTASEIEDFCSNCHNNLTGIDPSVPKRAENALSSVAELQANFSRVKSAVINANESVKDEKISTELDSVQTILTNIPSDWHKFNLTYFDNEVQQGITTTQNIENQLEANTTSNIPKKTPGFEGFLLITGIFVVYIICRSR